MPNSLPQSIKQLFADMQKNIHTCIPGSIKSFDASKCTATVQPSGKIKKPNGDFLDYPEVTEVPVCLLQSSGQDITIAYPIKEGDGCLVLFSEQQLDGWRDGQTPDTGLNHDITNGIAFVGLFADANDLMQEACDNNAIILKNKDDSRVTIKADETEVKVNDTILTVKDGEISAKAATFKIDGRLEVTGNITTDGDVKTSTVSLNTHAHTCTAPASPSSIPIPIPQ